MQGRRQHREAVHPNHLLFVPICRLPTLLVNQIAAGEVIERPASVVKELVENSIDSGAKRIDIAIEQGGTELIRVADNGSGIAMDELPLAIAPHATSKIQSAEDLDAIATMGFRGEALASIASVSRLSIVSRPAAQQAAAVIEVEGDMAVDPRPAGGSVGTTVCVRNLFFNTPARRKFLRAEQTEATRVVDLVENLAMAHPGIAFILKVDDRVRFELPVQSPRARVLEILGSELESELLEMDVADRGLRLWGMIGTPAIARGTAKHQRLFLNGRTIIDRSINHAIKEAYRGLIDPTRFPTIVLFLSMPPVQVDVNVHPTKAEVRFRNQGLVHGVVHSAVRTRLRQADLTPAVQLEPTRSWSQSLQVPALLPSFNPSSRAMPDFGAGEMARTAHASDREHAAHPSSFVEYFRRLDPVQKGFVYSEVKQAIAQEAPAMLEEDSQRGAHESRSDELPVIRNVADVMQVHSSYIVTQDEQGLLIIDQHALHERVMFEKLKARLESGGGKLESQRLLMPATVPVDRSHLPLLEDLKPLLERIGIEAAPIGPDSIAVHSFTSLLFERGVDPVTFMSELLDKASARGVLGDAEAALHETLDMMACKAAVKAGDRLAPEELAELLKYRETVERSSNCPHGRPTSLRLTLRELEKQFGRT